jgi:hypothetical protein
MALTDPKIRQAKPQDKAYKITDEKGLYLEVRPNGSKLWRHKYSFAGKEKLLSHGIYPEAPLAEARKEQDESRQLIQERFDPARFRPTNKATHEREAQNTFRALAAEWYEKQRPTRPKSTADIGILNFCVTGFSSGYPSVTGSPGHRVTEENHKLTHGLLPIPDGHRPFSTDVV